MIKPETSPDPEPDRNGRPPADPVEPAESAEPASQRPADQQPAGDQPDSRRAEEQRLRRDRAEQAEQEELRRTEQLERDSNRQAFRYQVNNTFLGPVDASSANFGALDPAHGSSQRLTGKLDAAAVDRALRWFVPPPTFDAALRVLHDQHLVVLVSADGSGRRTGGLALLRAVAGAETSLTSLSPDTTFRALATHRFEAGCLVADYLGNDEPPAVRDYAADQLAERLRQAGAYLVVTATPAVLGPLALRPFRIQWQPPDPARLLERRLAEVTIDPTVLVSARQRATQLGKPGDVVHLAGDLAARPEQAASVLAASTGSELASWLDSNPTEPDVLAVAALAFLHRLPQWQFERHLATLVELADRVSRRRTTRPAEAGRQLPVRRSTFARGHELTVTEPADVRGKAGLSTERVLRFRPTLDRSQVMAELHDRYGYELWEPVRRWLVQTADTADPQVRVVLASGIAVFAGTALGEGVTLIDELASSERSAARLTAATALWWMSSPGWDGADESLVPAALRLATRWMRDRGARRTTAAIAFGGELGLRYLSDALRWLWHLATQANWTRFVAQQSIADLFSVAVDDPASSRSMLRIALRQRRRVAADQAGPDRARAVRYAILAMLQAGHPHEEFAVLPVVRSQPENLALLGSLWADVLSSTPHRGPAYEVLVKCLAGLMPEQRDHAKALGDAVLASLSEPHRQLLRRDLIHTARNPAARTSKTSTANWPPPEQVTALLDLFEPAMAAKDGGDPSR